VHKRPEDIGLSKEDYEVAMRFTKDFYEENKDFIADLAKIFGKPLLVSFGRNVSSISR
jgi:hypothetical protein